MLSALHVCIYVQSVIGIMNYEEMAIQSCDHIHHLLKCYIFSIKGIVSKGNLFNFLFNKIYVSVQFVEYQLYHKQTQLK